MSVSDPAGAAATATRSRTHARAVTAIVVGNLLEWYDFAVYAALAGVLATLFFPTGNPVVSLLASFSVFAVGFAARPLGAILFGRMSDRIGRRPTLLVVITMMGVATVLIGVMPTYAVAGVWGALLLTLARTVQGLSVGGEFGSSAAFLAEVAPSRRRGLYGSFIYLTANLGSCFGLAIVFGIRSVSSPEFMSDWGWRIPFLLSFPLLLIGLYIRLRVQESPAFRRDPTVESAPVTSAIRGQSRGMLTQIGICVGLAVITYTVLAFALSYMTTVLGYPPAVAYTTAIVATFIGSMSIPFFGALSDRIGRRPMILAGAIGSVLCAYPAYLLLSLGTFVGALSGQLLIWLCTAVLSAACPAAFTEMYPTRLRTSAVGISYAVGFALFGGTTPVVSTWLVELTGSVLAPAVLIMGAGLVSIAAALRMKETAHAELPA